MNPIKTLLKMIFRDTHKSVGLWRGWLTDGQSVEISWKGRRALFGLGIYIHDNEDGGGHRLFNLSIWRVSIYLPLGIVEHPWDPMEGPRWGFSFGNEPDISLYWGHHYWIFDWPWSWHTLDYQKQMILNDENSWVSVFNYDTIPYSEQYSYTYVLDNGTVQNRTATVSKRRHVLTWSALRWLRWPKWIRESINIEFSDEVGERTGSWKGGCIECGYHLKKGETMEQSLRRMEQERKF
jgi:hypothetical protein